MTETKFTPGPWYVVSESTMPVIISTKPELENENDNEGAVVSSSEWTFVEKADAHLIAAAPDLYGALEAFATHFGPLDTNDIGLHPEAKRCFTLARAALAKARGET